VAAVFATPSTAIAATMKPSPGVAHEDPRGVVVVAEEPQRGAADDRRHRGAVGALEGGAQQGEGEGRDGDQAGRQGVHAVDQVDQIGEPGEPKYGKRVLHGPQVVGADKGQGDVGDGDLIADHGDQGDGADPRQLHDRPHATEVIQQAQQGHAQGPD
jgi:hypothetical protein